jgi:hypothetical protein
MGRKRKKRGIPPHNLVNRSSQRIVGHHALLFYILLENGSKSLRLKTRKVHSGFFIEDEDKM